MTQHATNTSRSPIVVVGSVLVTASVFLAAGMEVALLGSLTAKTADSGMATWQLYLSSSSFAILWLLLIGWQWIYRYSPSRAKPYRRWAALLQAVIATLVTAAGWNDGHPALGVLAAVVAAVASLMVRAWLRVWALHPDDQKEIDELLDQRDKEIAAAAADYAAQLREERKQQAFVKLGLTRPIPPLAESHHSTETAWQIPQGKHQPVVYFLRNGNRIKIGTTTELRRRIRTLALRHHHVALLIPGDQRTERQLHHRFAALRDGNSEWFEDAGALTQYIADHVNKKGD